MQKPKSSRSKVTPTISTPKAAEKLIERNLMGTSPLKEQFEPTDAVPVKQQSRMGGAG